MENQNSSQNQNLLCRSKHPERLPRILGIIGVAIFFLLFITDVSFSFDLFGLLFFFLFFILPALIGIIAIRKKPIMSGIFMFIVGWIYLTFSPINAGAGGIDLIFVSAGLLLIFGGILAIVRDKKILKTEKGASKLFKFLIIGFCFFLFIIFIAGVINNYSNPNPKRKGINDVKIRSDLSQIMLGVEMYYADNSVYPTTAQGLNVLTPTYVQKVPVHPVVGKSYTYTGGTTYSITAPLYGGTTWICSNGTCYEEQKKE